MKYEIGQKASFSKTISEGDVYTYAGITGDMNAIHINSEYAKNTDFKERIVHGMLVSGLISTVLGTKFPGEGTIYLEQKVEFCAPVKIGDTITACVEVLEILKADKGIIKLKTEVLNQRRDCVISGYAIVRVPERSCI